MKALLFDMDGVLVDVSRSYRETIKATVQHFAQFAISDQAVQDYKDCGGLNNDWDLIMAVLKDGGVSATRREVIDIFQAYYVGKNFDGLIRNENWRLNRAVLEELAGRFRPGIVTGRPAAETDYTLRRFDVLRFFSVVITMDDIPADRGKPDPLGIRLALSRLGTREGYYAGDNVDDMKAALSAGVIPLGIVPAGAGSRQRSVLLAHGAWRILTDINRIKEVLT